MTIASEIQRIKTNIAKAYTACNNKGATMPASQISDNLATCISTIPSGSTPTGTLNITQNGTYDVTNYANADVNVSGGGSTTYSYPELKGGNYYVLNDETVTPIYFDSCSMGGRTYNGTLVEMQGSFAIVYYDSTTSSWGSSSIPSTSNVSITLGTILTPIKHISFNGFPSSNYSVSFLEAFRENDNVKNYLTSVCISNMKNIGMSSAFSGCTNLSEVDVSSIDYLPSRAFYGSVAVGGAFARTAVQTLSFNSLNSNSFGSATNQFNNMLRFVTGCTVHFPSNLQSVIGSWSSVKSGFGGTNTTVLFDLPATT